MIIRLIAGTPASIGAFSVTLMAIAALLFGMNIVMTAFLLKTRRGRISKTAAGSTSGGLISGILGVGCAACGSFLLTSLVPLAGIGTAVAMLPFAGTEFTIVGILLLGLSLILIARQANKPAVCDTIHLERDTL